MTIRKRALAAGLMAGALLVAGCASRPDEELNAAKAAIAEARNTAQADVWAPEEYGAAQSALDTAEREIAAQDETSAMSRNYDKARESLARVTAEAAKARRAAEANRTAVRQGAHDKLRDAELAIDRARDAVIGAPQTKDTQADITLFSADLDNLTDALVEVEDLLARKDYEGATTRAEAIIRSAENIATRMEEARARLERR